MKNRSRPIKGRRNLALVGGALAAAALLALAVALPTLVATRPQPHATIISGIGGPFKLVDQNGRTVTDADFRGKWLLIYFGYTHCPDACPTALNAMAEALDRLGPARDKIQALFVTLDPERDTPAVLKDYTAAFQANILGLTGSLEQIAAAAREYRIAFEKHPTGDGDYGIDHSSLIFLVDPAGKPEAFFSDQTAPDRLARRLGEAIG